MPTVITSTEYLEVNSWPLATPAWMTEDLSDIYDCFSVRGGDKVIPYKRGQKPRPRIPDVLHAIIPMKIMGEQDWEGTPYSDPAMGLIYNRDKLVEEVFTPESSGDGTVSVVWHLPDGISTRTASGIVIPPFHPEAFDRSTMGITLELLIPSGQFVPAGS